MNTKLLINGKLVAGKGDKEDVLDPATGKSIASLGEASTEQVASAVDAAAKAFGAWRMRIGPISQTWVMAERLFSLIRRGEYGLAFMMAMSS